MKLTLSLLFVCVSVMVCSARAAPAQETVQESSMGTGIGEDAYAISDVYSSQYGRGSNAVSGARQGIAVSQSRSYRIGNDNLPKETKEEQVKPNEAVEANDENAEANAENAEANAENAEANAENAEDKNENVVVSNQDIEVKNQNIQAEAKK